MIKPFDLNPINRIYGKVGAVAPVVEENTVEKKLIPINADSWRFYAFNEGGEAIIIIQNDILIVVTDPNLNPENHTLDIKFNNQPVNYFEEQCVVITEEIIEEIPELSPYLGNYIIYINVISASILPSESIITVNFVVNGEYSADVEVREVDGECLFVGNNTYESIEGEGSRLGWNCVFKQLAFNPGEYALKYVLNGIELTPSQIVSTQKQEVLIENSNVSSLSEMIGEDLSEYIDYYLIYGETDISVSLSGDSNTLAMVIDRVESNEVTLSEATE